MMVNTDLVIVGCGAAGLLAAVTAGDLGLNCVVLERRHRVGLKLLLCGNNRCNVSHAFNVEEMLNAYGPEIGAFLRPAMTRFAPQTLRNWFARNGLATCIKNDRIYPTTEKGDDVLHCFTDRMRDLEVPLMLNCPVAKLELTDGDGIRVVCDKLVLNARNVLLATGGVSYPKTGSVGDGQRMLAELGIEVTPLRPGLAGVDVRDSWLQEREKAEFLQVRVSVSSEGRLVGETEGNMLCEAGCLRGTAIFDATRLIAHRQLADFSLSVDLCPQMGLSAMEARLDKGGLEALGVPPSLVAGLRRQMPERNAAHERNTAQWLKAVPLDVVGIRPLKEAIVTVGGVALQEVDPETMGVKRLPGVYVAGELLDVDGPTGGFNLHAAFATGHLAVSSIAASLGKTGRSGKAKMEQKEGGSAERRTWNGRRNGTEEKSPSSGRRSAGEYRPARSSSRWGDERQSGERGEERPFRRDESRRDSMPSGQGVQPERRPTSGRSSCDARKGNRWDNSEFDQRRLNRPEQGGSHPAAGKGGAQERRAPKPRW